MNGRLVRDESTKLPEGEAIYFRAAETAVGEVDNDVDADERAALLQALDEGLDAARAGNHVDAEAFVQGLLARA